MGDMVGTLPEFKVKTIHLMNGWFEESFFEESFLPLKQSIQSLELFLLPLQNTESF